MPSKKIDRESCTRILKILGTLLAILYLFYTIPFEELGERIRRLPIWATILAVTLVIGKWLTTTKILQLLLRPFASIPYQVIFHIDALDYIANSFVPSRAGSLVTTPVLLDRHTYISKQDGFSIKTIQFSMVSLLTGFITLLSTPILYRYLDFYTWITIIASGVIYLSFTAFVLIWISASDDDSMLFRIAPTMITEGRLSPTIKNLNMRYIITPLLLTAIAHILLTGARFGVLTTGFDVNISILFIFLVPIAGYAVSILPISLGGAGIVEVVSTTILVSLGIEAELAAALVITDRLLSTYLPLLVLSTYISIKKSRDLAL